MSEQMTEEEFSELSAKVLINEATEEEEKLHERLCLEEPAFAETFDLIKASARLLENYGPLVDAMETKEEKMPESFREELMAGKIKTKSKSGKTKKVSKLITFFLPIAAAASVTIVAYQFHSESGQKENKTALQPPPPNRTSEPSAVSFSKDKPSDRLTKNEQISPSPIVSDPRSQIDPTFTMPKIEQSNLPTSTVDEVYLRKQVPLDLGNTSDSFSPLIIKAISVHGGLRLAPPNQSRYSVYFSPLGENKVSVEVSRVSDGARTLHESFEVDGFSIEQSLLMACDRMVESILRMPGFFSGKLCYLSDASGKKEIFVSNSLMTSAQPQTSFNKITFNQSWDNEGAGIFFTSNRKVFNNIYHLELSSRRITTIANYRGSNLRAVQNPRNSVIAMILSTSGNPEVWLAATPQSKPKRITRNESHESGPCWSSDGRRLIVTSDSRGEPQLYEVSLSTGILTRIPTNVSSHCTEANWNPVDASKVAFTAATGGGFQVYEYNFNTRKSRALTGGSSHSMQPCWANDGRHLFFTERASNESTRLMILDTELRGAKPVSLHGSNFGNCSQPSFHYPWQNMHTLDMDLNSDIISPSKDLELISPEIEDLKAQVELLHREKTELRGLLTQSTSKNSANNVQVANLKQDMELISRELFGLRTEVELLRRENAQLRVTVEQLTRRQNSTSGVVSSPGTSFSDDYPQKGFLHKVEKGETLSSIAQKYESKIKWIIDANRIIDPTKVFEGKELFIPQGSSKASID